MLIAVVLTPSDSTSFEQSHQNRQEPNL